MVTTTGEQVQPTTVKKNLSNIKIWLHVSLILMRFLTENQRILQIKERIHCFGEMYYYFNSITVVMLWGTPVVHVSPGVCTFNLKKLK